MMPLSERSIQATPDTLGELRVDDVIVLPYTSRRSFVWIVTGLYFGGLSQESVIELRPLDRAESTEGLAVVPYDLLRCAGVRVYHRLACREEKCPHRKAARNMKHRVAAEVDGAMRVISQCASALDKLLGDTDAGEPEDDPPLKACRDANRWLAAHIGQHDGHDQ